MSLSESDWSRMFRVCALWLAVASIKQNEAASDAVERANRFFNFIYDGETK